MCILGIGSVYFGFVSVRCILGIGSVYFGFVFFGMDI